MKTLFNILVYCNSLISNQGKSGVLSCFQEKTKNFDDWSAYSFLYNERCIALHKERLEKSDMAQKMEECLNNYRLELNDEVKYISMWLDDCIDSHETEHIILSNYCSYEIPEENYGENERYPRWLD